MADNIDDPIWSESESSIDDIEVSDEEQFIHDLDPQFSPPTSSPKFSEPSSPVSIPSSPVPIPSVQGSSSVLVGSDIAHLSDVESPPPERRSFEFYNSRLRSEALQLEEQHFKAHFRMPKSTFLKLHEEMCDFFPQGRFHFINDEIKKVSISNTFAYQS